MTESLKMIKAYWWIHDGNNFGDILTPMLLELLTGEKIEFSKGEGVLVSTGSVANLLFSSKKVFWGSGVIGVGASVQPNMNHEFLAVRGPKTRQKVIEAGYKCPKIYGDPALLLPEMLELKGIKKKHKLGILPHHLDLEPVRQIYKDYEPIIDIRSGIDSVLKQALQCNHLITSSLHGLILGESYGIPTIFVRFSQKVCGGTFKFEDYFKSTGRELEVLEWWKHPEKEKKKIISEYFDLWQKPEIDLEPLVRAFPFEIRNEGIREKYL